MSWPYSIEAPRGDALRELQVRLPFIFDKTPNTLSGLISASEGVFYGSGLGNLDTVLSCYVKTSPADLSEVSIELAHFATGEGWTLNIGAHIRENHGFHVSWEEGGGNRFLLEVRWPYFVVPLWVDFDAMTAGFTYPEEGRSYGRYSLLNLQEQEVQQALVTHQERERTAVRFADLEYNPETDLLGFKLLKREEVLTDLVLPVRPEVNLSGEQRILGPKKAIELV